MEDGEKRNSNRDEEAARAAWRKKQERRRKRLRQGFEESRKRKHEPPPEPEDWDPAPWWKHSWEMLWDNPTGLLLVAIGVAILLYFLFPPAVAALF